MKRLSASATVLAGFALGLLVVVSAPAQTSTPGRTGIAAPPPATVTPTAPTRWTQPQLQEAFLRADVDGNGELSRAESQQLVILPRSFEDLDQNKDGVLSREEYEAILRTG